MKWTLEHLHLILCKVLITPILPKLNLRVSERDKPIAMKRRKALLCVRGRIKDVISNVTYIRGGESRILQEFCQCEYGEQRASKQL